MSENKYDDLSFNELSNIISLNKNSNDLDLANKISDLALFSFDYFFDDTVNIFGGENISVFYKYKYSEFKDTVFEYFSQDIKNNIYKKFIKNITLQGYISLKILELMSEKFDLKYTIYGSTKSDNTRAKRYMINIGRLKYQVNFEENKFFKIITTPLYFNLIKEYLPSFINEYNKVYDKNETLKVNNIDKLLQYVDLNNEKLIIKYIYNQPYFYTYLKSCVPQTKCTFWVQFFMEYKCSLVSKNNVEIISTIIEKMIMANYADDEQLFFQLIQTKSKSHMAMYFSKELKSKLRKDFNLSILCYKNSCSDYKKDVKKMLGRTITSTKQFKYLYG